MYAYIKGQLISANPQYTVIESMGIGFKILVPVNLFSKLPHPGSDVLLYTSFVVRELSQTLYGFLSSAEKELFEALLDVNGIGPKLALSIIGHMTTFELHQAVHREDTAQIARVPGIGKKTAERLIIELRDKLAVILPPDPSELAVQVHFDPKADKINDAMGALINLGYNQASAQKAVKKIMENPASGGISEVDLPTLITQALKII